jgi:Zn-dependent oligopeptidase
MHQLCSQTKWSRFHGTKVERDFVEAPSQMLENWCWEPTVLSQLSAHYSRVDKTTSKPEKIPPTLCDKIVKAKNVNAGLLNLRQIFFATFDLFIHRGQTTGVLDSTKVYRELRDRVSLIPNPPNTFPAATFGHVMGGCTSCLSFLAVVILKV